MEVDITLFQNPHKFWIFEIKSKINREYFASELAGQTFQPQNSPHFGQIVLVYDTKWKRALVKSTTSPYRCWLLDYGVEYQAKTLYKIPNELELKPVLAKQATLLDVVCLDHEVTPLKRITSGVINFNQGCIRRTKEYLQNADKILFKCCKEIDNIHFGHLTIRTSKRTFDLSDALISDQVLLHDPALFTTAFRKNCEIDEVSVLRSMACSPKLLSEEFMRDIETGGVGRGINRISNKKQVKSKRLFLEEWVAQSRIAAGEDSFCDDSTDDGTTSDILSSVSLNSNHRKLSPKQFDESIYEVETPSKPASVQKNIDWNDLRSNSSSVQKHLNIMPSGMLSVTMPSQKSKKKLFALKSEKQINKSRSAWSSQSENTSINDVDSPSSKLCVLGCKCEYCNGWSDSEPYFNKNKNKFEDGVVKKQHEFVKPSLLFKVGDELNEQEIRSCVCVTNTNIKRSITPTVLVHGTMFLSPVNGVTAAPFHEDVHKVLRSYEQVYSIQSYVWPAIMRHMNICIIGNRDTGKTMAYLPGICSFELERNERYPDLPHQTVSPISVILCPSVKVAEKVFNMILKLLENAKNKSYVAIAVQPLDKKCLDQFQKQVDLLVATPTTLQCLIKTKIITMKRLCHFVIEKANVVLEKFPREIENVLPLIQSMLSHRNCNYTVQMIITSEQWTVPIELLLKSLSILPVVVIGSYLEAAMYGRVDIEMQFLESKLKMSTLVNILKGKTDVCRTVVICNTNDEIEELREFLLISGIDSLFLTDDMIATDISEIESRWIHSIGGKHLALICTEKVFTVSINVTNAVLLVNYSLPDTWTQFVQRFRCMLDNYISPLSNKTPDDWTRCKVHVFVDESCGKQFLKVTKLLERLGTKLTPAFRSFFQKTLEDSEKDKLSARTSLCKNLKLFGKCELIDCRKRHSLSNELDYCSHLPKNGTIKFRISHIHDVACFGIKILDVTDIDGEQVDWKQYPSLESELNEAMNKEKNCVFEVKLGSWYAYHSLECNAYLRCAVIKIIQVEKITKRPVNVRIRCLDTGAEINVSCSFLYKLPREFHSIPAQVIDAYLANIMPPDFDDSWSYYSKTKVQSILKDAGYEQENTYEIGQILLQLGNMLWLKNIMVYEELETSNLRVNKLNLRTTILSKDHAILNERQLPRLYKLCANGNIELPTYKVNVKESNSALLQQVKPQWAHFDESHCTEIYIAYADTPSLFYVRLKKFYELFENLQQEIQEMIAKPFYPCVNEVFLDKCYLAKNPAGDDYARALVIEIIGDVVKVFFVDYGDYTTVDKTEIKYLPDELIAKLPFQAIECRLYGVDHAAKQWSYSAIKKFCDFVYEPDTDYFRTLYTTSCKQEEPTVKGGHKYVVLLVDNFTDDVIVINKMLIDGGHAIPLPHESINTEFSLPEACVEEEEVDEPMLEEGKEMTFDEIKKLKKKYGANAEEVDVVIQNGGEPVWDIEIHDPELFIKKLINVQDTEARIREINYSELPSTSNAGLPPADYCTPNIFWHQTDEHIKINVMLPSIAECDIRVLRGKILIFRTTYNNKLYKLELYLFDNVEKKFQYTLLGPHVRIILKKKAPVEWPRLIVSSQKMRFIKYDYTQCVDDEEKKKRFLDLGLEDDETEENGEMHIEYGSDEQYDESDSDSNFSD